MENILLQRLSAVADGKYDFLKLSQVEISKKDRKAEFLFLYPLQYEQLVAEDGEQIRGLISQIVGGDLKKEIKLVKNCLFVDTFIDEIIEFFARYPSIAWEVSKENIDITEQDEATNVCIGLSNHSYQYAFVTGITKELKAHFLYKYCANLNFLLKSIRIEQPSTKNIDQFAAKATGAELYLEKEGGRFIAVDNREEFIGDIIYDDARYISDARISESFVLCGKIEGFSILNRKPKPDETETKKFYKFRLRDFTAVINCLYFPTKKTENTIAMLCDNKSIIASGKIVQDNYSSTPSLVFQIRSITLCTLNQSEFTENRIMRKPTGEYIAVSPQPYINPVQASLFDIQCELPPSLAGKKYCVFDIETTGLDPENNEITEIGAVMIENGEIKKTFTTLISIQKSVPAKITQLTGITDADLVGKPSIEDVLMDFFNFSIGVPLVGQNVSFDYSFISTHGAKHHIHFDNERIDTLTLARKNLKNMKNFTLKSISEKLGIKNQEAHRALSDAITTAQVFLKLSKM